jgi:zinc-ribbon domain
MICTACGKANKDGSAFCEQCGTRMQAQPAAIPGTAAPGPVPVAPAPFPFPPAAPPPGVSPVQMGESLIANMSLGEKIAGAGSIAAVIGFFMPWISIAGTTTSYSGLDLGKTIGAVYLVLLNGAVCAALCYMSTKAAPPKKLRIAGQLTYLGALCGPATLTTLIFVPKAQSTSGFGLWLFALGFTAVATGGMMTIRNFSKRVF